MATEIGPFSGAADMLAALQAGAISSAELVELHINRIEERDDELNAIPVRTFPQDEPEHLLIERLAQAGVHVERRTALVDFDDTPPPSTTSIR